MIPRAAREAASRARQQQALDRAVAAKAAAPRVSWWICPPEQFYDAAHAQEPRFNAVTVAYPSGAEARRTE